MPWICSRSTRLTVSIFGCIARNSGTMREITKPIAPASTGTTTAIIGGLGAGKTTLLDLIPRLMDATAGTVRVDEVDVRAIAPEALWARIGMVPQRPYLFSGTVASNLRYGKPAAP